MFPTLRSPRGSAVACPCGSPRSRWTWPGRTPPARWTGRPRTPAGRPPRGAGEGGLRRAQASRRPRPRPLLRDTRAAAHSSRGHDAVLRGPDGRPRYSSRRRSWLARVVGEREAEARTKREPEVEERRTPLSMLEWGLFAYPLRTGLANLSCHVNKISKLLASRVDEC
jgi:hypothetical protein